MTTVATLAVKDTKDIDNTDRGGSRIISRNIGLIRGQMMCITAYARIESGGRSWGGRGKLGHGVASLRIGMPRIRGDRAPPSSPSLYSIYDYEQIFHSVFRPIWPAQCGKAKNPRVYNFWSLLEKIGSMMMKRANSRAEVLKPLFEILLGVKYL